MQIFREAIGAFAYSVLEQERKRFPQGVLSPHIAPPLSLTGHGEIGEIENLAIFPLKN